MASAVMKFALLAALGACAAGADAGAQTIVLQGGTLYTAPDQPPIPGGTLVLHAGKIAAVGARGQVPIPSGAQVIELDGRVVTAGFWNSHVHFTDNLYGGADTLGATVLASRLAEMLVQWGFTSVFDTGSPLANTVMLRDRVGTGEVPGPRILTTGDIIYPMGTPARKYAVGSATEALAAAHALLDGGASGLKLYAQAFWDLSLVLPPDAIRVVVALARERGRPVLAHPSNQVGLDHAVENGVNILVHTTPQIGPWSDALIAQMKARHVALIPTLALWRFELQREGAPPGVIEEFVNRGVAQLRQYVEAGGPILFGTDVGYMTDVSTRLEYELMGRAGMGYRDVLAALTTTPATVHGMGDHSGRLATGFDADIVVLDADPAADIGAFAHVAFVFREGRLIHRR